MSGRGGVGDSQLKRTHSNSAISQETLHAKCKEVITSQSVANAFTSFSNGTFSKYQTIGSFPEQRLSLPCMVSERSRSRNSLQPSRSGLTYALDLLDFGALDNQILRREDVDAVLKNSGRYISIKEYLRGDQHDMHLSTHASSQFTDFVHEFLEPHVFQPVRSALGIMPANLLLPSKKIKAPDATFPSRELTSVIAPNTHSDFETKLGALTRDLSSIATEVEDGNFEIALLLKHTSTSRLHVIQRFRFITKARTHSFHSNKSCTKAANRQGSGVRVRLTRTIVVQKADSFQKHRTV
eukprot:CAMPEP_0206254564 /NCGR_PEP_ID=MMETSP0047_2-20121206/23757_1 /ASSEMBLY_ACC=CAM_ASM_000192 /TAXON_ID=195065 /ORGANISM="Chroomonas mesostigmatica_cf, Strain CCMP1168" /LENGTH=295 /DNA_ID=CAMNT_0053680857 /DNA_START=75 /DNA_END=962 /DNA_ORIENTATION=+